MIRVVLVDGQTVVREGLRSLLSSLAELVVVGQAGHREDLFNVLPTVAADVVVLDGDLFGPDAPAIIYQLRAEYPRVQVLALGLLYEAERIAALLAAGARGYLLREARLAELVHGIHTVAAGYPFLCSAVGWAALQQLRASGNQPASAPAQAEGLTRRETEVLTLIAQGLSSAQIAERLFLSPRTVETHRQHMLKKTQAPNMAALIRFAFHQGLVT